MAVVAVVVITGGVIAVIMAVGMAMAVVMAVTRNGLSCRVT